MTSSSPSHPDEFEHFSIVTLLATAYIEAKCSSRVPLFLAPHWKSKINDARQRYLSELLLVAYTEMQDPSGIEEILQNLQETFPNDARAQAVIAEHFVRTGNIPLACQFYQQAVIHAETNWKNRFSLRLGQLYYRLQDFEAAVKIFAPIVNTQSDSNDFFAYVICLYNSGEYMLAMRSAQEYREVIGVIPVLVEIEASVLEKAGNLTSAKDLWKQLIAAEPTKASYKIRLAFVEWRAGLRHDACTTLLSIHLGDIKDNAEALLNVAQLRAALQMSGVLVFAYRARQIAPGDAQVHGTYVRLCMETGEAETNAATLIPMEVRIDDAVHLMRNGKSIVHVILNEGPIRADHGELSVESPRAQVLLGKRQGQIISFDDGMMGGQEYEITEIMSKYVYACHETIRLMGDGTLQIRDMHVGDVTDPDFIPNLLDVLDRQSDQTDEIMAIYKEQPIPLSTLAIMRHRSLIETWLTLTSWPEAELFAFAGSEEEVQTQAGLISTSQEIVLDLPAVLSIIHLGIENLITRRFSNILVAQSLLDELHEEEHHLTGPEPKATLGSNRGQSYFVEMPVGHTRPYSELVQKVLHFITTSTHVMGVMGLIGVDEDKDKLLGRMTIASILLAKEKGIPLYSDDLRTRQLANHEWQVGGFDTQGVLADLHMQKAMDSDRYYQLLSKLSLSNYHFVRLNVDGLLSILEQNTLNVNAEVRSAFRSFKGPGCTEESAIIVLSGLTAKIWCKRLMTHQKTFILDLVLETLVAGRSLEILNLFRQHVAARLRLTPFYRDSVNRHIEIWVRQHPTIRQSVRFE